ncbi:methylmalonyl Co-A mutase-associated GTPase MeaB [Solitalea canadensis]|uniref:LAO/AO transport system ATPase n=1 Tax=Solitalea canadensis (strain ATCC 29591 / DSM 3403 / JCM 21819 / LMG 8368 / NBRC 15130 / NCIMB 12057 / USAM 9D) TaxID=929556 RepID=H8KXF3_SOLCM|nr:methylmalonyl Co-A mutase-associated GTPase MeaB [Solitalea canadensis]AFD08482.1 LAO/AO transport system ATPase [Solitalea canadensis DSM 3403]
MKENTFMDEITKGNFRAISRAISLVENESEGSRELLLKLDFSKKVPVIGITGPPGAGKSTLVNMLIRHITNAGKKVGIVAIDPTSPFNYGSLLGDRIRMVEHFNNDSVFIRSLATRGSLGGLSTKTIEVVDIMKAASFDYILVETVGVGQSEVEIVGLADTTIVVLVPEAGDEIQTIKSGLMEIADIFVVNKADHIGADEFAGNIKKLLHQRPQSNWSVPVVKTIADKNEGIGELFAHIEQHHPVSENTKKPFLLVEKAFKLIQQNRMRNIRRADLLKSILANLGNDNFNLYRFVKQFDNKEIES